MIIIGKISHPYGILGWVHLISFTEVKKNIFNYFPWTLEKSTIKLNKNDISIYQNHSKNYILKLKNINNRNEALGISKKNIYISRNQLPPLTDQEYYWKDILICYIYNYQKKKIGPIIRILDNNYYNTLEIFYEKKKKNIYIPFITPEIIKKIDLKNKIIIIKNINSI